tara:strand:- start:164 stop:658 length:495 start_codon:yes stop_codon:yes gene_type:complete
MTENSTYDFVIVGAGIAGASAAYFLAGKGSVLLLEMESQPGYHTTGRSAALYTEAYGNRAIRALTSGGRSFLVDPPDGFCDDPILTPRGVLFIGRQDQMASLDATYKEGAAHFEAYGTVTDTSTTCSCVRPHAKTSLTNAFLQDAHVNQDGNGNWFCPLRIAHR